MQLVSPSSSFTDYRESLDPIRRIKYPGLLTKPSMIQLGYSMWADMIVVGAGLTYGFSAVALPQIRKDEDLSPTFSEVGWIASAVTLTAPVGVLICGWIMNKLGRKPALVLTQLPMSIGWFYTWSAISPKDIIVGRVITGIGLGMAVTVPRPYIAEITLPNVRVIAGVICTFSVSLGIFVQAILGTVLGWRVICFVAGVYSSFFLVSNLFLPESPYHILMTRTILQTRKNLQKFRGRNYNINDEMEGLMYYRDINQFRRLTFTEKIRAATQPKACKKFWSIYVFILIAEASGVSGLLFYAEDILEKSRSSVSPKVGNLLLCTIRILVTTIASVLLLKVRRRPMAIICAVGVSVICIALFFFLYFYTTSVTVVPQLFYMLYVLFASLGYRGLPLTMGFEVFPYVIRNLNGLILIASMHFTMFCFVLMFLYIENALTLPYTILACGISSLVGSLIICITLPETRGMTAQHIADHLRKPVFPRSDVPSATFAIDSSDSLDTVNSPNTKKIFEKKRQFRKWFKRQKHPRFHSTRESHSRRRSELDTDESSNANYSQRTSIFMLQKIKTPLRGVSIIHANEPAPSSDIDESSADKSKEAVVSKTALENNSEKQSVQD